MVEKIKDPEPSSWTDIEFAISGPQTVEDILNEAVLWEGEKRGVEKGKKQQVEQIEEEVTFRLKRYFDSILDLATTVRKKIATEFPNAQIIDFRTFFLPLSDELNLFIIFDTIDFETEIKIGFVLSEIERAFWIEHNHCCEILYVRKSSNLDITSVKRDYPFILKA
jgi:hypothetical protein